MFNPNEHMMKLKGKDYLQVMWRLVWFREDHPDWSIDASIIEADAEHAVFKATICDETGALKCSGHGSESKRDFGDYLEKAETKAVGRALAMLGYGTQFTATELDEGERIVDSPVERTPRTGSAEAAQEAGHRKLEQIKQQMQQADQSAPAAPVSASAKGPATDEQIAYIRENADGKLLKDAMNAFGSNMERMSSAQANKLIARIKKANDEYLTAASYGNYPDDAGAQA